MKNNFQNDGEGRSQRVWQLLISMLFILTMGIGQMWGAVPVETYNSTGAGNNTAIVKTGSTLPGNYDAGTANKPQGHSESGGVKLRTQNTKVTLNEVEYGYAVITANAGYSLKSFQLDATSNSSNSITLYGVYVDVDATNASTLATAIGTATNKLSSNVVFPNKNTNYTSTSSISINASSNIVMIFSGSGDNQLRAVIKVGYEKLTYAVTYLPGENGTGSVDAQVKTYGENLILSSSTFSRDNHTQAGWSLTDGGEKAYELGGTYTGNAALTLYPYWVSAAATSHSISYDGLKGSDVSSYPTSFYEGVGVASFEPLADITGWHFTGWSPSSIGTEVTTDQTITAQWTPVYAVSFNMQDHGSAIDPQNVISGQKASEPEEPEANGWEFGGWYKEAACTNVWDFSTETVTEATELFAKWTEFDCSGTGTLFSISSLSGDQKVAKTADSNNPTWMNLSTYGTVSGGKAKAGNKDTSNDRGGVNGGRIAWDSGNAMLWIHFNCPIATGDKINVTGLNPEGGALYVRKAYSTTTDQLTIDKDNTEITFPAAFDGLYDVYLWRNGSTTTYVTGVAVTRTPCTKPTTPIVTVDDKKHNSATIVLDGGNSMGFPGGTVGYKVYVEKTSDHTVIRDWVDCATQEYALTGLEAETTYTVKAKAVGGEGKCALGDESDGVDFATLVKTCPTSGVVFSMALKSGASTRSLNSGASYDLTSSDVTIEGGSASIKNIDPDNNGKMKISSGPKFDFQGNKAYVKVVLDCPLQAGDKIEIAGGSGKQIAITPTEGIPTDASVKVTTSSYTYTITAADVTAGFAGPTILTYYLGRADASSTQITGITITRPYAITFANGGHGTAPSPTTGFEVALTQITGVDGWIHTGWTANKVVKVGGSDVAVGTAVAVDATAAVSDDTQFTAVWVEDIPAVDPEITFNDGAYTIGGEALNLNTLFTSNNTTGAVTYTVKTAGETGAAIDGTNFTATAAGSAVVTATQAASVGFNEKAVDATITISAPAEVDGVKLVVDGDLTGNYRTACTLTSLSGSNKYTIAGLNYTKYIKFGSSVSSWSAVAGPSNKYLAYTPTKKTTNFYFYVHNNSSSASYINLYLIEEGNVTPSKVQVEVAGNANVLKTYELNITKNTEVYITAESNNVYYCQVVAVESGDALPQAPAVGYEMNLNKGRLSTTSATATSLDGLTFVLGSGYSIASSTVATIGTKGTHYVSFTIPEGQTRQLQLTTSNTNKYTVSKTKGDDANQFTPTANEAKNWNLTPGTWYINPQGSNVQITNIAFAAAPTSYTVTFDADGGSSVDDQIVFEGGKATEPTAPTKSGYDFIGWYNGADLYDFDGVVSANLTLTAHWTVHVTNDATLKSLKYGEQSIALEDGVYEYNVELPYYTVGVPELTAVTNSADAKTPVITNAAALDANNQATSTVSVTSEDETVTLLYQVHFTKVVLYEWQEVSGSINWDFTKAATAQIQLDGSSTIKKDEEAVMANIPGTTNNATFNSQALKFKGEYIHRSDDGTNYPSCATTIKFKTTVPGVVTVRYADNGGNNRCLSINGHLGAASSSKTDYKTYSVCVPAGEVVLTGYKDGSGDKYMRFFEIDFTAASDLDPEQAEESTLGGYERTTTQGRIGTICLPKAGVMVGADLFEVAYYGETSQKVFLDQIVNGEMEAGVPYFFLPKEGAAQLGVYYTGTAVEPAGTYYTDGTTPASTSKNGLIGFIGASAEEYYDIPAGAGNYIIQNNQYREVPAGAWARVQSNRAYFRLADITQTAPMLAPGRHRLSIGINAPQVTTGLDELNVGDTPVKVMIDGNLYILRGENMYDATGRLVK